MDKRAFTKSESRELRRLAGVAYERELTHALDELEEEFKRWRAEELNAFDLSDSIHEFHNGQARELWKCYNGIPIHLVVASAVARGALAESEIPERLRAKLPLAAV